MLSAADGAGAAADGDSAGGGSTVGPRSALITGVTGQDGWYLSELLIAKGQRVYGLVTIDDANPVPDGVTPIEGDMRSTESLARALEISDADVVYNLAAVSSVAKSWADPVPVADIGGLGVARLLAAARDRDARNADGSAQARITRTKIVHASSAEIFGDASAPQSESTPVAPTNPYGAAKAFAQHLIQAFRAEGMWAATAILFPHESPRRPDAFVSRKITRAVAAIAKGSDEPLVLGNLDVRRDWGFAGDYAQAMTLIAQHGEPADFVIATGSSHTIREFVAAAFAHVGIEDWQSHVTQSEQLMRPTDAAELRGDAARARHNLGWAPTVSFDDLVAMMVDADLALYR